MVVVPLGTGTALSRLTVSNRVISISVPNVTNGLSTAWQTYLTSAYQIELATGFNFFTAAPGIIPSVYRTKVDGIAAPTISGFLPTNGPPGTSVTITGQNLTSASAVFFNGLSATITGNSGTQVTATVPISARTGHISVITPGGFATSPGDFAVINATPAMAISVSITNSIIVSWPASASGFVLQENNALDQNAWTTLTNGVSTVGDMNEVVLFPLPGGQFFRLKSR